METAPPKEFTLHDVSFHVDRKDLYVVIHNKVYNASSFMDQHPGGEEVLLDVAGKDATDSFEDVGHSDEAREILSKLYIGDLKVAINISPPYTQKSEMKSRPESRVATKSTAGAVADAKSGS